MDTRYPILRTIVFKGDRWALEGSRALVEAGELSFSQTNRYKATESNSSPSSHARFAIAIAIEQPTFDWSVQLLMTGRNLSGNVSLEKC